MGYKYKDVRKGVYRDGHQREDVIQYRQMVFLPILRVLGNRIVHWEMVVTPNGETLQPMYLANLPAGVRPIVLIGYDETTFNPHDGRNEVRIKEDYTLLKQKSRGRGIMVSDFLVPGGRLQVPSGTIIPSLLQYEASDNCLHHLETQFTTCSIQYGGENWWDGDKRVEQVLKIGIPIFETAFPGCEALFLFDNATSHSAYASNALRASAMNLCPGGEQVALRSGQNSLTNEIQVLVMADRIPKGLRMILEERGLWRARLRLQCCKENGNLKKQCLSVGTCCARALMANERDFKAQPSRLEEEVEFVGHQVHFFPKYHCKLNFIEYY